MIIGDFLIWKVRIMKVGIINENLNDSNALITLLQKYLEEDHELLPILPGIEGSQWDSNKALKLIKLEYKEQETDIIIMSRDLDAFESERKPKQTRNRFFNNINNAIDNTGVKLLHIWELEALLFADIENLNTHYGTTIPKPPDVMNIKEPKEELSRLTKNTSKPYREGHVAEVCNSLDTNVIIENCKYFQKFIRTLRNTGCK